MQHGKLLLIDDDRLQAQIVRQQLNSFRSSVFEFEWASTYEEGLERLLSEEHTACLLDFQLGPRDGLALIREAREKECAVPIIFLTADSSPDIDIEAMNAGALDYLVKGEISPAMLERSLRYALKLSETLAELKRLATRDALTGLLNRREFNRLLAEESERSHRFGRPFSLVLLDIDRFKSINDRYGHPAGDSVLRETAERLQGLMRKVDRLARFGGEEIVALLVELDQEQAHDVAERMLEAIRSTPYAVEGQAAGISVTTSAGVAAMPGKISTAKELLSAADDALYRAKRGGRDRVESA
ncbi:diguanylate cyclase [Synoicihabitans lomoniglobus]|uniref:diguanylate cyclase n=1 Tax=Synoicihabitans lomoniglobus TaxID=2909285 RepID=A0AAF0CQD9_9BACT|nr:diguanylate cyclase [Opitutaceae bacterium LMO-M01]WED66129.1 diguanylate cyclase [Opitutaceae bacterium LMO-M01]